MQSLRILLFYFVFPLLAVIALMLAGNAVIGHFTKQAAQARGLSAEMENGIRHTYAACLLHELLRNLNFSREHARGIVLSLGLLNEYAEQVLLFPRDTTLELRKDLHNNLVGVELGEWLETQPLLRRKSRLAMVGLMAEKGQLVEKETDTCPHGPECAALAESSSPRAASEWFAENRALISRQAKANLESIRIPLHQILDNGA